MRFEVARRLGLDPRSLLEGADAPRFLWTAEARFKHASDEGELERAGITSFGRALAAVLISATPVQAHSIGASTAEELRESILRGDHPFVDLVDLLSLCWATGVPVAYLRVFPWPQKRMAAMTVRVRDRWAILLAQDSEYPARVAFWLAHEIGHIALGHLAAEQVIVDLEPEDVPGDAEDKEEGAADEFGLELLTGHAQREVLPASTSATPSGRGLAEAALAEASKLRIEPGTLALSYGYSTGDWKTAYASLKTIYKDAKPAWSEINRIAMSQIHVEDLPRETAEFLQAVLGTP